MSFPGELSGIVIGSANLLQWRIQELLVGGYDLCWGHRRRKLFQNEGKTGGLGDLVPQRGPDRGRAPVGSLGDEVPQKLKYNY